MLQENMIMDDDYSHEEKNNLHSFSNKINLSVNSSLYSLQKGISQNLDSMNLENFTYSAIESSVENDDSENSSFKWFIRAVIIFIVIYCIFPIEIRRK